MKKKSSKSKSNDKKKKKSVPREDKLLKRLTALESVSVRAKEKPLCQICNKDGHLASNCWYYPNFRGILPSNFQRARDQQMDTSVNQIFPCAE